MTKIEIKKGLLKENSWLSYLVSLGKRFVIITDTEVERIFGRSLKKKLEDQGLECTLFSCAAGEQSKSRECKAILEDRMIEKNLGKDTVLIALGGGVITDLGGYIAATFCRGIPYISIPTSLLAMVDASIGGKVGVNTPSAKNQIGVFYHPKRILVDVDFLSTLPQNEWINGSAEIIKYGLIASSSLFDKLEKNYIKWRSRDLDFLSELIEESIAIKQDVVQKDPEEKEGLRRILNCGHTIGHALESASAYRLSHGEAISIGMIAEAHMSHKLSFLPKEELEKIESLFHQYGFSLTLPESVLEKTIKENMQKDKKALLSNPRFVLLEKIGKTLSFDGTFCTLVDSKTVEDSLSWMMAKFRRHQ